MQRFRRRELAAQLALMSQANSTYFPYTVYETVMLGRYQHLRRGFASAPSAQDKAVVERCLASTGLLELRNQQLDCLSGGQRQRVFLAHTLAQEPKIILLDEPTNHLDIRNQLELIKYLRHWTADGQHMVIGVFHDLNLALQLSTHMLFLQQGRLVRSGPFFEVADREFLHKLYGMDICAYMEDSLTQWRKLGEGQVFCQEMEGVYCME